MLKVIRIRSCSQCGEVLGKKCQKCIKHPNRKPRIIDLYDFPTPLKVAECGCCILIKCQNPNPGIECKKTFWRSIKNNSVKGKSRYETFVCGPQCRSIVGNLDKKTSIMLSCGYCRSMVRRQPAQIPLSRIVFCKPECWYLYRRKTEVIDKEGLDGKAMLECLNGCKDVTEHSRIKAGIYKCLPCGKTRHADETGSKWVFK